MMCLPVSNPCKERTAITAARKLLFGQAQRRFCADYKTVRGQLAWTLRTATRARKAFK
jgi:hypothetical protein